MSFRRGSGMRLILGFGLGVDETLVAGVELGLGIDIGIGVGIDVEIMLMTL